MNLMMSWKVDMSSKICMLGKFIKHYSYLTSLMNKSNSFDTILLSMFNFDSHS